MAFSMRNVEKFLNDHPELFSETQKGEILTKAKESSFNGLFVGVQGEELFGEFAQIFFQEITANKEHIEMGLKDLRKSHA